MNRFLRGKSFLSSLVPVALIVVMLALVIFLFIDLMPLLEDVVKHIRDEQVLIAQINQAGAEGFLIIVALQALQIITVIFPSVAIQVLAGLALGIWRGLVACVCGYLVGNTLIFVLVRQLTRFVAGFDPSDRPSRRVSQWDFSFVRNSKHATVLALLLFLIPGIPNGILPYLFAKTEISLPRYLLCISVATSPTILLSSLAGAQIASGHFLMAGIAGLSMAVLTILVLAFRKRILAFIKDRSESARK